MKKHKPAADIKKKKDSFYAKVAFILSLGFWIPLFNIGLCIISIVFAVKALRLHLKNPKDYGGLWFAVAAFVISAAGIITSLVMVLTCFLAHDQICANEMCRVLLPGVF